MLVPYFITTLVFISTATARLPVYTPYFVSCPKSSLVRPAEGLAPEERTYRSERKIKTDIALQKWLRRTDTGFQIDGKLPTIALTSSGDGYRSLLTSAGVVQALDARDTNMSTSGLYQALTYHVGISGGSWMLSSMAGNNFPTISELKKRFWKDALQRSVLDPGYLWHWAMRLSLSTKWRLGYNTTLVDAYGRLLSYQLLGGFNGGVATTFSSVASFSAFKTHDVPFPIITSIGERAWADSCAPQPNGTMYEFSPYEFGSWDREVSAFYPTKYLGSAMENGKPQGCTNNYDNLGFILGTSSNVFPTIGCSKTQNPDGKMASLLKSLVDLVSAANTLASTNFYALYPNPFYRYQSPTGIRNPHSDLQNQSTLFLADGGSTQRNNPIFPLLQLERGVDVILVNDNSADTNNFPNGTELFTTYTQALAQKLTRMPYIPPVETFLRQGLHHKAVFFGCGVRDKVIIIWMPNAQFTYPSNKPTSQLTYQKQQIDQMIANGVQVASQGGDEDWAFCLACGIMVNSGPIPRKCEACLANYCYKK